MKGYFRLKIPVKNYVKGFLLSEVGEGSILTSNNLFGNVICDLLQRKELSVREEKVFENSRTYSHTLTILISHGAFRKRGIYLSANKIKCFNRFVELMIKERLHNFMDMVWEELGAGFEESLPELRKKLKIDLEYWSDDSIKKDWYRYRVKNGKTIR